MSDLPATSSAMERLRADTAWQHRQLESLPFFKALAERFLPRASYIGWLRATMVLHRAVEDAAIRSTAPVIRAVWRDHMRKLPLIARDLQDLDAEAVPEDAVSLLYARLLAEQITRQARREPVTLLGCLYVLEGATLGGKLVRAQVRRAFALPDQRGTAYLSSYDGWIAAHWKAFTRSMNDALRDPRDQQRAVEAANNVFAGLANILGSLYPLGARSIGTMVHALNPEAGSHAISDDLREVEAALRAGERSWERYPYYAQRYGERGKRFTHSDSAWIASLVQHKQPVVDRQIAWLGRVLAARGMPRILLEQHLELLYEELARAVPEREDEYRKLLAAARMLRELREDILDATAFEALAAAFDSRIPLEWRTRMRGAGSILVAAVVDEEAGITQAVTSLEGWMTDPARFPAAWRDAVCATLNDARRVIAERHVSPNA